jgi:L-rhamnose mutarotase
MKNTYRNAFKMKLKKGFEMEYKKRHDEIWPELASLLSESGIQDYSIFLDEETPSVFTKPSYCKKVVEIYGRYYGDQS